MAVLSALSSSKLQKLKIFSYKKAERTGLPQEFEAMFNPDSIRQKFKNHYHILPVEPISQGTVDYAHSLPSSVSMKLILDNTGADDYAFGFRRSKFDRKSVPDRVNTFLKLIVRTEGEIHEPQHLTIVWGKTLNFNCRLNNLSVNYTLFDKSGKPLRAELDIDFIEDDLPVAKVIENKFESPDLTHYRMVKEDDQLPLMCQEIYGSSNYYTLVAKANNLDDFRNLKPGQEIYFPPIEK